jgi:putative membrane protein
MMGYGFGNGFGMGYGGGFMWLFWILLIVAIVWAVKAFTGSNDRGSKRDKTALEILQERYARGEIDQAEFEQKRKDLRA